MALNREGIRISWSDFNACSYNIPGIGNVIVQSQDKHKTQKKIFFPFACRRGRCSQSYLDVTLDSKRRWHWALSKAYFCLFLYFLFWFIFLLYSLGLLSVFFVLCFGFFYFLISWEVRIRVTTTSFQKRWTAVTPIAYCFSVKAFSQTLLTFVAGPSRWRDGKGFLFLLLVYIF